MLDVRRLRLLAELSRRGTIAAVARTVGYTPSAVSQSLAQLEREVGLALLERGGGGGASGGAGWAGAGGGARAPAGAPPPRRASSSSAPTACSPSSTPPSTS